MWENWAYVNTIHQDEVDMFEVNQRFISQSVAIFQDLEFDVGKLIYCLFCFYPLACKQTKVMKSK